MQGYAKFLSSLNLFLHQESIFSEVIKSLRHLINSCQGDTDSRRQLDFRINKVLPKLLLKYAVSDISTNVVIPLTAKSDSP